ncbi:MAG TPA: hypothetical protein VGE73_01435, partial [Pseudolabrys sp.]
MPTSLFDPRTNAMIASRSGNRLSRGLLNGSCYLPVLPALFFAAVFGALAEAFAAFTGARALLAAFLAAGFLAAAFLATAFFAGAAAAFFAGASVLSADLAADFFAAFFAAGRFVLPPPFAARSS